MTETFFRPLATRVTRPLLKALAVLAALQSLSTFAVPPPLDAKIVEMMKTNSVGIVEARIHFVEKWEITMPHKAQVFFSMFDEAKGDDQRKLAHAAVKHVANTNYALIQSHLLDPELPRTVLSVFMTDTLKRSNAVKLPVLLQLARLDAHPLQDEARQLLRGYLGRDHGTNWVKWEEAMQSWLKTNPT